MKSLIWTEGIISPLSFLKEVVEEGMVKAVERKSSRQAFKEEMERIRELCSFWNPRGRGSLLLLNSNSLGQKVFYPRNWINDAQVVSDVSRDSRKIYSFSVNNCGRKEVTILAKARPITCRSYYEYAKPKDWLFGLSDIDVIKSASDELFLLRKAQKAGVLTETPLAIFERGIEQYLYVLELKGENPLNFFSQPEEKKKILFQDAQMLARILKAGLWYPYFYREDWHDKLYNNNSKTLFLREVVNLEEIKIEFPPEKGERGYRKDLFKYRKNRLIDVVTEYRHQGILGLAEAKIYMITFFNTLGFPLKESLGIVRGIELPEAGEHQTLESWLVWMSDTY